MSKRLLEEVSYNVGEEYDVVSSVLAEFGLQLHKRLVEYEGLNGDYIGEELSHELPPQGFYHLLGFLSEFSEKYNWDESSAHECLMRLGKRKDWMPFLHQMEGWSPSRDK